MLYQISHRTAQPRPVIGIVGLKKPACGPAEIATDPTMNEMNQR
jgi:hypothetical protein